MSYDHGQSETFQWTLPCSLFSMSGSFGDSNPCYDITVYTSHLHDCALVRCLHPAVLSLTAVYAFAYGALR